jgi:cytochrome c553
MQRRARYLWTLLLACGLAAALAGCSDDKAADAKGGKTAGADLAAGKAVAQTDCQPCHLIDGRGTAPGIPNLAGEPQQYLVTSLGEYRSGRRMHGALRNIAVNLSDADTQSVTAYFANLQRQQAETNVTEFSPFEHGKTIAPACISCHGENGISSTPGTPNLAGQQPQYFVLATQEYLNGTRQPSPMHGLIRGLNKLDIESVALYFGSYSPKARPAPNFGDPAAGEKRTVVCAGCHGVHGISVDTGTPSLASQDPTYLVSAIKAYRNKRPHAQMQRAVAALTDKDVDDIAAYYAMQQGRAADDGPKLVSEIVQKCNRCHGPEGAGATAAFPLLYGQDKDYLVMALRAYRDGRRQSSVMHNMSIAYGDAIIESLASFYASQTKPSTTEGTQ